MIEPGGGLWHKMGNRDEPGGGKPRHYISALIRTLCKDVVAGLAPARSSGLWHEMEKI